MMCSTGAGCSADAAGCCTHAVSEVFYFCFAGQCQVSGCLLVVYKKIKPSWSCVVAGIVNIVFHECDIFRSHRWQRLSPQSPQQGHPGLQQLRERRRSRWSQRCSEAEQGLPFSFCNTHKERKLCWLRSPHTLVHSIYRGNHKWGNYSPFVVGVGGGGGRKKKNNKKTQN